MRESARKIGVGLAALVMLAIVLVPMYLVVAASMSEVIEP
jgi:hypothetical protein